MLREAERYITPEQATREMLARHPMNAITEASVCRLVRRLRYRQLALLVALGRYRNVHRAAEAIYLAQPSATKALRELERIFGFPLFERLPRNMNPTKLGADVVAFAQGAIAELQAFTERLEGKRQGGFGTLLIGTVPGAAPDHVGRAIAEIKRLRPYLSISLVSETNDELIELLLAHRIDLAIGRFVESLQHHLVTYERLGCEVFYVVARSDHAMARVAECQLSSLKECSWVLPPPPSPARQIIEQEFGEADLETPANIIESAECFATLQIIQQSDAIALLPEAIVRDRLHTGLIARLPVALGKQRPNFGILIRRSDPLSEDAKDFRDILRCNVAEPDFGKKGRKSQHAFRDFSAQFSASSVVAVG
jgi:DNA-binding transcriptional LysR family regulator